MLPIGNGHDSGPCASARYRVNPAAFAEAYRQAVSDSSLDLLTVAESALEGYQALFDRASGGIREVGTFGDPERWRFDRERSYTRDEWLDELPTSGALTRLAPEKLAEVLEGVGAVIDAMGAASRCTTPRWLSPRP